MSSQQPSGGQEVEAEASVEVVLEIEMTIEQLNRTATLLWITIEGPLGRVELLVWVGVVGGGVIVIITGVDRGRRVV